MNATDSADEEGRSRARRFAEQMGRQWSAVPQEWRTLGLLIAGGLALVAVAGILIAKLVDDVLGADGVTRLDPRIASWVVDHRTSALTALAKALTTLGDPIWVTVATAVAVVGLSLRRRFRLAAFVVASAAGAALVTATGKLVVGRPRPPASARLVDASGPAFPSGHATQSIACWFALAVVGVLLTRQRALRVALTTVGLFLALSIGASRVYLGVHWASDVVCGWAVASLWLTVLLLVGWAGPRALPPARQLRQRISERGSDGQLQPRQASQPPA